MEIKVQYKLRREQLFKKIANNSIVIIPGASLQYRSKDAEWFFRQHSDFYYLTGFIEPEAVAVLAKTKDGNKFFLFNQEKDPLKELWTGERLGQQQAKVIFEVDEAYSIERLDQIMVGLLKEKENVYYPFADKKIHNKLINWLQAGNNNLYNISTLIHEMRLIKTEYEIEQIRRATKISAKAHEELMKYCKPGMMEYQLEAKFAFICQDAGCRAMAYLPIVGGGKNACVLHYMNNNCELKDGDLVLIDAGGEYSYYAADITRTFPINGVFSTAQRKIYELVLQAQLAGIAVIKPGVRFEQIQKAILQVIIPGLIKLDILKGKEEDIEEIIEQKLYKEFYMHGSGHWLGLDVHDVGEYKQDGKYRKLQAGMVLTVEPGIYIRNDAKVDAMWHDIGIRIEDDILVTKNGHEVLTEQVPKTIDEIEKLMQQGAKDEIEKLQQGANDI